MFGCRLRVCVAGGCRGPLFVLGPFVLAGDGLRGGAFVWVLFAWFFHLWERSWFVFLFLLASSVRERERFLDNGQAAHCLWCVVVVCFVFVRFLGLSLFCDSSDLKGF